MNLISLVSIESKYVLASSSSYFAPHDRVRYDTIREMKLNCWLQGSTFSISLSAAQYQYAEDEAQLNEIGQAYDPYGTVLETEPDTSSASTAQINVKKGDVEEFIYGNVPVS